MRTRRAELCSPPLPPAISAARLSRAHLALPHPQSSLTPPRRPYHRFFGQCLQLLHAARLAGGGVAMKLARMLIGFSTAPPGAILPLRSLLGSPQIPGSLQFPRERLRVPIAVGLPYFDVPLAPLLNRLDCDALMMLYTAMLSERRILFVAQAIPTLTACVHAAVALLQPFEWQNIFIPVRRRCARARARALAAADAAAASAAARTPTACARNPPSLPRSLRRRRSSPRTCCPTVARPTPS